MELVREFVETVILTGRVKDYSPVSAFLIAQPESGKTSICLDKSCESVVDVSDATGRGIVEILKYKGELTHLVFNDLTVIGAHKDHVKSYTISMINAMTEEGIRTIAFPGQVETLPEGKRAIIACTTPDLIRDGRNWFNKIGLSTRILPFAFSHPHPLQVKIKDAIDGKIAPPPKQPGVLNIPKLPILISCKLEFTNQIRKLADTKSRELGDQLGYRRLKQFHALARGHALWRTRKWKGAAVGREDIDFLIRILPHISYKDCHAL